MTVTPRELNTSICTLQDIAPALQAQNEINNLFFEIINGGGVTDTYKVAVNGSDVAPDYLHSKINQSASLGDTSIGVNSFTVSDVTERFYVDFSAVGGYDPGVLLYLSLDSGVLTWSRVSIAVDSYSVLVTNADTTPKFLHNCFNLNAAYTANADILVGTETVGAAATNQTERLFVDVSEIAGWAGTGDFFLGMHNNVVSWMAFSDVISGGGGYGGGYAIVVSGATIHFDPTEIAGFAPAFQIYMHFDDATTKFDPLWQTVDNYDPTEVRVLSTNGTGGFTWAGKPSAGASGTFTCTLTGPVSAGSEGTMGTGSGTVYSISNGAGTNFEGARTIFNPFKISLPDFSAGTAIIYTCARTYVHRSDEAPEDDQFTITGIDPLHLLAFLGGYGAGKALYTDGSAVTDMKWGGKQCSG